MKDAVIAMTLTRSEIENLIDFIDCQFIEFVRTVDEIDNMEYIVSMCNAYVKLRGAQKKLEENDGNRKTED